MDSLSIRRIATNTLFILIARILEVGAGFIIMIILCRYMQPVAYGDYAFVTAIVLAFQPIINLEMNTILIRDMAENPRQKKELLGGGILLKIIMNGFFLLAIVSLTIMLPMSKTLKIALMIASFNEIFQQFHILFSTLYLADERMIFETLTTSVYRLISITGIAFLAWIDPNDTVKTGYFLGVFVILAIAQLFRTSMSYGIARKFFKMSNISLSWFQTKKLIKKTWIIGVATFCTALSFRVDIFILKILAPQGSRTIALFHVPHMVVLQLQVIAVALVTALFPTFSRFAASNQSDKAYLEIRDYAFRFLSVSGIWIAMFLIIFAKPLILLLGGSSYLESVSPMKILAWCIPILFLNYLSTNLLTSFKRQNVLIVGAAVSLVINVILDITLIPSLGAEGAAWGTLIAYTSQLMIAFGFLMSIGDRSWGLWNSIGIPVLMGLAALFLWSFAFDAFENLLPLFGSGFLLALLVGFYVIQPKQLKNLLKAFFRTRRSPHV